MNSKRSGAVLSILNTGGAPKISSGVSGLVRVTGERMSATGEAGQNGNKVRLDREISSQQVLPSLHYF